MNKRIVPTILMVLAFCGLGLVGSNAQQAAPAASTFPCAAVKTALKEANTRDGIINVFKVAGYSPANAAAEANKYPTVAAAKSALTVGLKDEGCK